MSSSTRHPSTRQLSGELVMYAGRLVRAVTRAAENDVPSATLRLLALIDELGPATVGHLSRADRCSQPTMSAAVQNLTDKGWAEKTPNPADARSCLAALTVEGREVLRGARHRNADIVAARIAASGRHSPQDVATAVAVLRDVLDTDPDNALEGTS